MNKRIAWVISLIILCASAADADTVTIPNEFTSGDTISSSQVNSNFKTLADESNENDGRISALEGASLRPLWIDGADQIVGELWGEGGLLVRYPESSRVFQNMDAMLNTTPF